MKIGKKYREWQRAKKYLMARYFKEGITKCEYCGSGWALSFHHLDKRSSGRAEHTFEATRLLCSNCHYDAEYDKEFNKEVRELR